MGGAQSAEQRWGEGRGQDAPAPCKEVRGTGPPSCGGTEWTGQALGLSPDTREQGPWRLRLIQAQSWLSG